MIEREREAEFITWIRARIAGMTFTVNGAGPLNPRLSAMREAGGVDYRHAEAQSIAFQVEFADIETARKWSAGVLADTVALFEGKFGPQAMAFASIFELVE